MNGSEVEQAKAGEQFRLLIDPINNPGRYPDLHSQFPSKAALVKYLADTNKVSARTLWRKLRKWEDRQIVGLTRKVRTDKGISRTLNEAAKKFIEGAVLPKPGVYGELSNRDILRLYNEERVWRSTNAQTPLSAADRAKYWFYIGPSGCLKPSAQLPPITYATICRYVATIPELVKTMARQGDEAYRNGELISYRDLGAPQPLDYVVMDHRLLDIFCLAPQQRGWKLIRPWLTAAIDMRTRKWLACCIVETPSSDSIATVLKQVFVDFGLPKALYWDNGKDFRCQWLEGRREESRRAAPIDGLPEKWQGVLESLNIRVHHAIVRNARAKLIEPNFNNIANFDRTLPEWCGHRPGARPERFAKLLRQHEEWESGERGSTPFRTIEEVAQLYSDFIEHDLNERPHQGEGMRKVTPNGMGWQCPNEAWEILIPRVARRTVPEGVLQLCFAKRRELTVRNGEVCATFGGKPYHYRLTMNRMALLELNGRRVELAYDPYDLGEAAVYYNSEFFGLAHCLELRRMGEDAFVQDERDRRAVRREVKKFIAAVHQTVPIPDAQTHIARRQAVAPERSVAARLEIAAPVPTSVADAYAAREADRAFSFENCKGSIRCVVSTPEESGDDVFDFFGQLSEATPVEERGTQE